MLRTRYMFAAGLLAMALTGIGCGSDDGTSASLTGPSSDPSATAEEMLDLGEVGSMAIGLLMEDQMEGLADRGSPWGQLNLTQEQMQAIRAARQEFREAVADLIEQYGPDPRGDAEFLAALRELRAELDTAIAEILTAEQLELLEQLRLEQLIDRLERLIRNLESRRDRVIAFLDETVDLTAEQEAAIAAIFDSRVDQAQTVVDALEAGTMTIMEAKEELRGFLKGIGAEIRDVLTPGQWETLRSRHHGDRGNGPRGPRGPRG